MRQTVAGWENVKNAYHHHHTADTECEEIKSPDHVENHIQYQGVYAQCVSASCKGI